MHGARLDHCILMFPIMHDAAGNINGEVFSIMEPGDLKDLNLSVGAVILLKRVLKKVSTKIIIYYHHYKIFNVCPSVITGGHRKYM